MAIRRVYGSLDSPATMAVLAFLFEHDLDFEFVPIDLDAGENKKQPFLSLSDGRGGAMAALEEEKVAGEIGGGVKKRWQGRPVEGRKRRLTVGGDYD
ncbi:glutathione transferase [Sarracenia purpurea var. burkii]